MIKAFVFISDEMENEMSEIALSLGILCFPYTYPLRGVKARWEIPALWNVFEALKVFA